MTTMAALLGAVPIALGYGAGGEARRPLGLAVVGGLLFSQLITLYLTPVVYTYMAAIMERWKQWKSAAWPPRRGSSVSSRDRVGLLQANPAQQVLKARVGAQWVEQRTHAQP